MYKHIFIDSRKFHFFRLFNTFLNFGKSDFWYCLGIITCTQYVEYWVYRIRVLKDTRATRSWLEEKNITDGSNELSEKSGSLGIINSIQDDEYNFVDINVTKYRFRHTARR